MCLDTVLIYIHVGHTFSGETETECRKDSRVYSEKISAAGVRGCQGNRGPSRQTLGFFKSHAEQLPGQASSQSLGKNFPSSLMG